MTGRRSTRRELVAAATVAAGLAAVPPAWGQRLLRATPRVGPGAFLDSVASGDPSPTQISLWSRLTTDRPRSGARVIVARDEGLSDVVAETVVPTGAAMDHCLKTRIGGLAPGTQYFYAFESGDGLSPVGRTRTANHPTSDDPVRLAVSSCQNFDDGYFTGHTHAAAQDPYDLVLFTGDYTYETADSGVRTDPADSNDLGSYRDKLRLYRTDAGLRELHRLHPCAHIWDDHEVADNYTDNDPAPSPLQRMAGYRASFEWLPRMTFPDDRYRTYKPLPLGRLVEVLTLDERQYRIGDGDHTDTGERPFLGRAQLGWLKDRLAQAQARGVTWKVLANQLPVFPIRPIDSAGLQNDQWEGFQAERDELLGFVADEGIEGVVFVTGDIHTFIASELSRDFAPADHLPVANKSVAVDYVCGSITSQGVPTTEATVTPLNPHIKQFNGAVRGYGSLDLTTEQLVTDYRAGPVDQPDRPVVTIERFTQEAGAATFDRRPLPLPRAADVRAAESAAEDAGAVERAAAQTSDVARRRRDRIARLTREDRT